MARAGRVLGSALYVLRDFALEDAVPPEGRWFLKSAEVNAQRGRRQTLWEIECIHRALFLNPLIAMGIGKNGDEKFPIVLLKGAAYQAADLPWGRGRLSVDVDILTPESCISRVETGLSLAGWQTEKKSKYDDHYYRDWMHEIPPMVHRDRATTLDVHHTILPRTGHFKVDADLLFDSLTPVSDDIYILSPCGMLLHSVVHMLVDGELNNCMRDLLDIAAMFRYFPTQDPEFFEKLRNRTIQLKLQRPLYYAVTLTHRLLGTEFPAEFLKEVPRFGGNIFVRTVMFRMISRTLEPEISGEERFRTSFSRLILYIRSHLLRMPLHILIPHLWTKYWNRRAERKEREAAAAQEAQ